MSEEDKQEILTAIAAAEGRIKTDIRGLREHEAVNLDAMVRDVKFIRRTVHWLQQKWEKFTRDPS
jgi:hypothetical protein